MKEYFPHNYHARHDPKLQKVFRLLGLQGIGIYWCLVEILYEENGEILDDTIEGIAFALRLECECIATILRDYELFYRTEKGYRSYHADECIKIREQKSKKGSQAAEKRWGYANALPLQCKPNAIKVKERKKENTYTDEFESFWKLYPKKKSKGDALKAWLKISSPVETLELIKNSLSWQIKTEQWIKEHGQFIPYPATYLNASQWLDEPVRIYENKQKWKIQ